ncbi:hypothetical protein CEXT_813321 [Caerostris extrusa]|uniref:PWWP domain-containing protein n=1 Tax=Caerostris extrusa TaxID=172846 RepID=A0AAV4RZX9_CAEEX|nr:hypothetical protein CEXT_813321 [Caerostris extrusa]
MEIDLEEMDDVIKGVAGSRTGCRSRPSRSYALSPRSKSRNPRKSAKVGQQCKTKNEIRGEKKKTDSGEPSGEDAGETRRPDQITQYVPGDLISAQMKGYPSWPAMIDIERQNGIYFKIIKENTHYNVRFFDEPVTRAWVAKESIKELRIKIIVSIFSPRTV